MVQDFTLVQKSALSLIQNDLQFLYTVTKRIDSSQSNYIPSLLPYMGVIIDGVEDWIKAYNNSHVEKLDLPTFTKEEEWYYEKMRESVKMWELHYNEIFAILKSAYKESEDYFSNVCRPIAKKLKLYDIYGVDKVNGLMCGNTILCYYYNPLFSFDGNNGEYIKSMSEIGGAYIALFDALKEYKTDDSMVFDIQDYGGFKKSPVGNPFSDRFVLLSIMCQLNFLTYCIDGWIEEETSTKLRFAYLLYYSLLSIIPQINSKLKTSFDLDPTWKSKAFRNNMAHYKLGVSLKDEDIIKDDIMYGLTQKFFDANYITTKEAIMNELKNLSTQIEVYLGIKDY